MKAKKTLVDYFKDNPSNDKDYWNTDLNCYHISGFAIIPDIMKLNPKTILDLGCGYNEFKRYFPQLVGVDFSNRHADVICDFVEYECPDNSQDVILALGSINFISIDIVSKQVDYIHRKLRPGGTAFIRVNPAQAPDDSIDNIFYAWSIEDIYNFTSKYNFTIKDNIIKYENRIPSAKLRGAQGFANVKLYWEWVKE
jgi:SAM-dependent methyltransferase